MKLDIDKYLERTFHATGYNCWHFVRDVWSELTGKDLGDQTPKDRADYTKTAINFAASLEELPQKVSPCIVLMLRSRSQPHVGVYYGNRVLHLNFRGAEYRSLDQVSAPYSQVKFYR